MILVDSSALIEYYRAGGAPEAQEAVATAIAADEVAVNGIIKVEVLGFASDAQNRRRLESDFNVFHWLDLTAADYDFAARLSFDLRRLGITVPATDLIIAASAIQARAHLFHADRHFNVIAQHSSLVATHVRQ